MSIRWLALHDAAGIVATLAGLPHGKISPHERNFPAIMRDSGDWRREMAEQGIDDLSAIMQAGIAALLGIHTKGASPVAPARALWNEFTAARAALLALAPPVAA